jgi:hypothetical protein
MRCGAECRTDTGANGDRDTQARVPNLHAQQFHAGFSGSSFQMKERLPLAAARSVC